MAGHSSEQESSGTLPGGHINMALYFNYVFWCFFLQKKQKKNKGISQNPNWENIVGADWVQHFTFDNIEPYGTIRNIIFEIGCVLLFLHNSNGTAEIPNCGNLEGADWVWSLRWDHTEPNKAFFFYIYFFIMEMSWMAHFNWLPGRSFEEPWFALEKL